MFSRLNHLRSIALALTTTLALLVQSVIAQTPTATIQGLITDPSGAVIPGAKIIITNDATNLATSSSSNAQGLYVVPQIRPGLYSILVEHTGFRGARRNSVLLQVADSITIDFKLELGDTASSIDVTAETPLVNTTDASLGQVIENRRIVELPLNGREPFSLAGLSPGVIPPPPSGFIHQGGSVPSINGASNFTSEVLVDGMPNTTPRNGPANNFLIYTPTVDAVSEFKVQTNATSAEFGRFNGGVISVVMKSGTNQLHGSAYEFLRNSAMDANDFFNNKNGIALGALRRNQFGFTLGGPVVLPKLYHGRDRTFFFIDYEGFREKQLAPSSFTVPTVLERQGDFSQTVNSSRQSVVIYDPLTLHTAAGVQTRDAFPGNVIPKDRMSPVAAALAKYYPSANNSQLTSNLALSAARNNVDDTGDARLDHNFGEKNRLFGRYSIQYPYVGEPNFWGNPGVSTNPPLTQRRHSFTLQDTHTFSGTLILNVNYGLARMYGTRTAWSNGLDITTLGFAQNFASAQQVKAIPGITISGMSGIGNTNQNYSSQLNHTVSGSLTKIAGAHTLIMGSEFRTYYINQLQNAQAEGALSFASTYTQGPNANQATSTGGYGYATFLLGIPSGTLAIQPAIASKSAYQAFYLQDNWHVSSKLTLNIGVRYDLSWPRTERYNRLSIFDLKAASPIAGQVSGFPNLTGAMTYAGPDRRSFTDPALHNVAPRFGFSYQLFHDTTIRGGYGVFYGLSPTDASGPGGGYTDGFTGATSIVTSLDGLTPIVGLANPFPNGINLPKSLSDLNTSTQLGQAVSSVNIGTMTPYFQNWNFSVQHSLRGGLLLEAAYAGNKGTHVTMGSGINLNALTADQYAMGSVNNNLVANPFYGVITDPTSSLSAATIARGQLIRPYPQYTSVNAIYSPIGNSSFHSLQAKVERRFSKGFTILTAFTAGKLIDDTAEAALGQTSGIQDPTNLRAERSLDPQDVSRRLVISAVWDLPIGRGRALGGSMSHWEDLLIGGWQLNGIATFQTGYPLVMSSIGVARPDRVAQAAQLSGSAESRLNHYFDTAAYAVPAAFRYGNSSRTAPDLRAPGLTNFDLSMFKNFALVERLRAQLRFETFNAFNHPYFSAPGTQAGSTTFGAITSTQGLPRQMQVALKLIF